MYFIQSLINHCTARFWRSLCAMVEPLQDFFISHSICKLRMEVCALDHSLVNSAVFTWKHQDPCSSERVLCPFWISRISSEARRSRLGRKRGRSDCENKNNILVSLMSVHVAVEDAWTTFAPWQKTGFLVTSASARSCLCCGPGVSRGAKLRSVHCYLL